MIVYRCDRCGAETTSVTLFDVELIFTPRDDGGNEDLDKEERLWLGHVCSPCSDLAHAHLVAFVKPATAQAQPDVLDLTGQPPLAPNDPNRGGGL